LFVFALLFNTSLATNENGEVSLSLTSLQLAQAQDEEDCEACNEGDFNDGVNGECTNYN